MLLELRIRNFAIIDSLSLEFNHGLVVMTGETGAGKSIIMGALDMLLGQRVDMSTLRSGSDYASVEAVFQIPPQVKESITALLEKEALMDDDQFLTLTRELRRDKRNIARVNGHRTNVSVLVELGEHLVDIHGQSEHLSLMRVNQHLGLLDRFAGNEDLLDTYQETYRELMEIRGTLARLRKSDLEAARRQELLEYQVDEIQAANLDPDEEAELNEQRNRLVNAEKLATLSRDALTLLEEAPPDQPTVIELFGEIVENMEDLSEIDGSMQPLYQQVDEIFQGLSEIGRSLRVYLDSLEFDPGELNQVMDRVELIRELKKKYGETIQEILTYQEKAQSELNEITDRSKKIEEFERKETILLGTLAHQGKALSDARHRGAETLTGRLESQLDDLKMAGARFQVDFKIQEDPQGIPYQDKQVAFFADGLEKVEFLIETNPGEGLKPLVKVASGGETARLMLAIKQVLAEADQIATLVFDEIDQGIGGRIGTVVGEKLFRLAQQHQVFCITHLPQLAGFGQQHFQVSKTLLDGRSVIDVNEISGKDRLRELATMLGGMSETTLESARELLDKVGKVTGMQSPLDVQSS